MSDNVKAVIEALIFASEKPLTLEQVKSVLDTMQTNDIRKVIEEIKTDFEAQGRGVRIVEIAGGFQMIASPDFAPFLKKFYKQRKVERLSKPALETLAIIAYKQPLTKSEIQALRSVNVDGVVNSLVEKGQIRVIGRKKAPGTPFVYGTSRQFLEYFGLKSLEDLPKIESLQSAQKAVTKEQEPTTTPQDVIPLEEVSVEEGTHESQEAAQAH